ncbi:hypothetical protein Tco_1007221 [Tanacetum coccineum]
MKKNLALLAKYSRSCTNLPTTNLRTSSNSRNNMKIPHQSITPTIKQGSLGPKDEDSCKGYGIVGSPTRMKDHEQRIGRTLQLHSKDSGGVTHLKKPVLPGIHWNQDDSNVIPDSSNICTNDNQVDQNAAECVDERAALANLIQI